MTQIYKGGNSENDIVASPWNIPIHNNITILSLLTAENIFCMIICTSVVRNNFDFEEAYLP